MSSSSLGRTTCVALQGVRGAVVDVEAHLGSGLPAFVVGGLPDKAISQAPDRIRAAATSIGESVSQHRVTVNLSPAAIPKHGTGFDLAIVTAYLAARRIVPSSLVARVCHIGELGLDGCIRPVRGVLPAVMAAARAGIRDVVVAPGNVAEARLVDGVTVRSAPDLPSLVAAYDAVAAGARWPEWELDEPEPEAVGRMKDLAHVVGQHEARQSLEIAAAGGHHLMLNGPPGVCP